MSDEKRIMNNDSVIQLDKSTPAEREMADKIVDVLLEHCGRVGYAGTTSVLFTLLVQAIGGQMNDGVRTATVRQMASNMTLAVEHEYQRVKAKVDASALRLMN